MMPAEIHARITAAAAARADFEQQRRAFASGDGGRPEWADWSVRLAGLVGDLLAVIGAEVERQADRPTASTGVRPDGSAVVARSDLRNVIGALHDAAACADGHRADPAAAVAYRRVGRALGGDR